MKMPIRYVDIFRRIVSKTSAKLLTQLKAVDPNITQIHYDYGHYNDIKERLIAKGKTAKDQRYPLIVLFEDFKQGNRVRGLDSIADVKIIILHLTRKDYTRQQREDLVFKPVLVPIYDEFLKQMKISGDFMQYGPFRHDRIDRPHWGDPKLYANGGYLFDDVLDGIELANLELKAYLPTCVTA